MRRSKLGVAWRLETQQKPRAVAGTCGCRSSSAPGRGGLRGGTPRRGSNSTAAAPALAPRRPAEGQEGGRRPGGGEQLAGDRRAACATTSAEAMPCLGTALLRVFFLAPVARLPPQSASGLRKRAWLLQHQTQKACAPRATGAALSRLWRIVTRGGQVIGAACIMPGF